MSDTTVLTTLLVEALAHLARAQQAVNTVLAAIGTGTAQPDTRAHAAQRTTGTQILAVMADHHGPVTLLDITDGVVALRRSEDEPRKGGGTRYQEICRTSLGRLIDRGLVERVPPADKRGLMRFRRAGVPA